MKIKICGLFRDEDIDYVNEARPDYAGLVFAESRRKVSPAYAARLRRRLLGEIVPVGVFVNAPVADIASLYREDIIAIAQLHGTEDDEYIERLKTASAAGGRTPIAVIKTIQSGLVRQPVSLGYWPKQLSHKSYSFRAKALENCYFYKEKNRPPAAAAGIAKADYYLIDSGAGSGKPFNWELLNSVKIDKPWFLAGGIGSDNIERAITFNPFALDISGGAETDGVKDRKKIIHLVSMTRKGTIHG